MTFRFSWLLCFIVACGGKFNPYKVLEVSRKATVPEIKNAYRSLSVKFNPDNASGGQKEVYSERMTEINQAYEAVMASSRGKRSGKSSDQFVRLTRENFEHFVKKQDIWIILITAHYCRDCAKAREMTEKACAYLEGMVHCGSISKDNEMRLVRDLGVRKLPTILLRMMGTKYQIPFSRRKTEASSILKAVSTRVPTQVKKFKKLRYLESFLRKSGDIVRGVFISATRTSPHILHQCLAHQFRDQAVFGFVSLKNFGSSDIPQLREMMGDNLQSPMLALFENPEMPPIVINLSSDMEQMIYKLDNALQRVPVIPKMQVGEYWERCYTNTISLFDASKVCILLLLSNPALWTTYQKKLVHVAQEHSSVQFMWVDCTKQTVFCNEWNSNSTGNQRLFEQGSTLRVLGIRGPQNIHALSPYMERQANLIDPQGISSWVSNFASNDEEITYYKGRCTFPREETNSGRNTGLNDALGTIGSSASSTFKRVYNLFSTLFFLFMFLLMMFVVMSSRNGSFQVHFS